MARRSYDKQFKIAAVKLVLEENMPVSEVAKELSITITVYIDGLVSMKSTEKVRSQVMGAHFILISTKSKN